MFRAILDRPQMAISGAMLGLMVIAAVVGPWILDLDPNAQSLFNRLKPPMFVDRAGVVHYLGTDQLGRDVLARLLHGSRISLLVGWSAVLIGGSIGLVAGIVAGYHGGWVDALIMRLTEMQLAFPSILLAMALVTILGPSVPNVIIVLSVASWIFYAKVVRGEALKIRHWEFIEATRALGLSVPRVLVRHILPNVLPSFLVIASFQVAALIIAEAALSFLGFGVPTNVPSWGTMMANGREYVRDAWWLTVFPGLATMLAALSFNMLGDALRDLGDPTMRGRSGRRPARAPAAPLPAQTLGDTVTGAGAEPPLLDVRHLQTCFHTRDGGLVRAVDDVSLQVKRGEIVGLVGESGSGKSVTSLSIMRLLPKNTGYIAGGSILLDGADLTRLSDAEMRRKRMRELAMIFQDPMSSLNPVMTVGQQITEILRLQMAMSATEARARALDLMSLVEIPDARSRIDDYPHQFSGGMRQRIVIAMALSCNPKLLIADEPTTALDVTVQATVLELIDKLRREFNMGVILITHDLGVVAGMADRINVMYAGRIVESAATDRLFARPRMPYTADLLRSIPRLDGRPDARLWSIPGLPPNLRALPEGCRFTPRCRFAIERCHRAEPMLSPRGPGHMAACHFDIDFADADAPSAGMETAR